MESCSKFLIKEANCGQCNENVLVCIRFEVQKIMRRYVGTNLARLAGRRECLRWDQQIQTMGLRENCG